MARSSRPPVSRDKPWAVGVRHYAAVIALRSPLMLAASVTYALALRLFGVNASVLEMLGYLPVIFFGAATRGPMHSVAIVLWVILFPDRPGEMTAFAFVQHNFFVLFNAAVALLFLRIDALPKSKALQVFLT
jgi:hypothetical protein